MYRMVAEGSGISGAKLSGATRSPGLLSISMSEKIALSPLKRALGELRQECLVGYNLVSPRAGHPHTSQGVLSVLEMDSGPFGLTQTSHSKGAHIEFDWTHHEQDLKRGEDDSGPKRPPSSQPQIHHHVLKGPTSLPPKWNDLSNWFWVLNVSQ